jgi:hypothetical protein
MVTVVPCERTNRRGLLIPSSLDHLFKLTANRNKREERQKTQLDLHFEFRRRQLFAIMSKRDLEEFVFSDHNNVVVSGAIKFLCGIGGFCWVAGRMEAKNRSKKSLGPYSEDCAYSHLYELIASGADLTFSGSN